MWWEESVSLGRRMALLIMNPSDVSHRGSRSRSSSWYFTAYPGTLALSSYPCQQQNTALPSVFITLVARQVHRAKVGTVTANTSLKH